MAVSLYEGKPADDALPDALPKTSITPGIVVNNLDCLVQGKILVRLPQMNQEIWARLSAPGAGSGTGMFHAPNIKDEVLVALIHSDPADAYILGGLWSTTEPPPIAPLPTNVPTKRIIRSGLTPLVGHEIEFDDALQTLTITSSMPAGGLQKIKLEPTAMTFTNPAGSITIGLNPSDPAVTVAIDSKAGIKLSSKTAIQMSAPLITIESSGLCVVSGKLLKLN
jgi:phage baseplate assembly protein gpV